MKRRFSTRFDLGGATVVAMTLAAIGCGQAASDKPAVTQAEPAQATPTEQTPPPKLPAEKPPEKPVEKTAEPPAEKTVEKTVEKPAEKPAEEPAEPVDDEIREPATIAQATRVLDLAKFPHFPDGKTRGHRLLGMLYYQTSGDLKAAYEFTHQHLLDRQWTRLKPPQTSEQSISAQYRREGFYASLSVSTQDFKGKQILTVMLFNHGNVNLRKLPVPPGAKLEYSFPSVTSFKTTASVAATREALHKLLLTDGWQQYGGLVGGDSLEYKKNAVILHTRVLAPPVAPDTTVIDFKSEQMSADLPAPPSSTRVDYSGSQLYAECPDSAEAIVKYYQTTLKHQGWQATTDKPIVEGRKRMLVFRNPEQDMLTLNVLGSDDGRTIRLEHLTEAELAEIDRKIAEQAAAAKKKKADDEQREKSKPQPSFTFKLPANAKDVKAEDDEIRFTVPAGQGKKAAEPLAKQLTDAGWKAGKPSSAIQSFEKDGESIRLIVIDPGAVLPAEVRISTGFRLKLNVAK